MRIPRRIAFTNIRNAHRYLSNCKSSLQNEANDSELSFAVDRVISSMSLFDIKDEHVLHLLNAIFPKLRNSNNDYYSKIMLSTVERPRLLKVVFDEYFAHNENARLPTASNILISSFNAKKEYQNTVSQFDFMKQNRIPMNYHTIKMVLEAFEKLNNLDGFEKLFEKMRKYDMPLTIHEYSLYLRMLINRRRSNKIILTLQHMRNNYILISPSLLSEVLFACDFNSIYHTLTLFTEDLTINHAEVLLDFAESKEHIKLVEDCLKELDISPSVKYHSLLIKKHIQIDQFDIHSYRQVCPGIDLEFIIETFPQKANIAQWALSVALESDNTKGLSSAFYSQKYYLTLFHILGESEFVRIYGDICKENTPLYNFIANLVLNEKKSLQKLSFKDLSRLICIMDEKIYLNVLRELTRRTIKDKNAVEDLTLKCLTYFPNSGFMTAVCIVYDNLIFMKDYEYLDNLTDKILRIAQKDNLYINFKALTKITKLASPEIIQKHFTLERLLNIRIETGFYNVLLDKLLTISNNPETRSTLRAVMPLPNKETLDILVKHNCSELVEALISRIMHDRHFRDFALNNYVVKTMLSTTDATLKHLLSVGFHKLAYGLFKSLTSSPKIFRNLYNDYTFNKSVRLPLDVHLMRIEALAETNPKEAKELFSCVLAKLVYRNYFHLKRLGDLLKPNFDNCLIQLQSRTAITPLLLYLAKHSNFKNDYMFKNLLKVRNNIRSHPLILFYSVRKSIMRLEDALRIKTSDKPIKLLFLSPEFTMNKKEFLKVVKYFNKRELTNRRIGYIIQVLERHKILVSKLNANEISSLIRLVKSLTKLDKKVDVSSIILNVNPRFITTRVKKNIEDCLSSCRKKLDIAKKFKLCNFGMIECLKRKKDKEFLDFLRHADEESVKKIFPKAIKKGFRIEEVAASLSNPLKFKEYVNVCSIHKLTKAEGFTAETKPIAMRRLFKYYFDNGDYIQSYEILKDIDNNIPFSRRTAVLLIAFNPFALPKTIDPGIDLPKQLFEYANQHIEKVLPYLSRNSIRDYIQDICQGRYNSEYLTMALLYQKPNIMDLEWYLELAMRNFDKEKVRALIEQIERSPSKKTFKIAYRLLQYYSIIPDEARMKEQLSIMCANPLGDYANAIVSIVRFSEELFQQVSAKLSKTDIEMLDNSNHMAVAKYLISQGRGVALRSVDVELIRMLSKKSIDFDPFLLERKASVLNYYLEEECKKRNYLKVLEGFCGLPCNPRSFELLVTALIDLKDRKGLNDMFAHLVRHNIGIKISEKDFIILLGLLENRKGLIKYAEYPLYPSIFPVIVNLAIRERFKTKMMPLFYLEYLVKLYEELKVEVKPFEAILIRFVPQVYAKRLHLKIDGPWSIV
jgi:hypothetical protein